VGRAPDGRHAAAAARRRAAVIALSTWVKEEEEQECLIFLGGVAERSKNVRSLALRELPPSVRAEEGSGGCSCRRKRRESDWRPKRAVGVKQRSRLLAAGRVKSVE